MPRPLIERVRERYGPGRLSGIWRTALSESPGELFVREVSLRWEDAASDMLEGLALLASGSWARGPLLAAHPPPDAPHDGADDLDFTENEGTVPSPLPRESTPASGRSRLEPGLEAWALDEFRGLAEDAAEPAAPGKREPVLGDSAEPRVPGPRRTSSGEGPPFPRRVSPWLEEELRAEPPGEVEETLRRNDVSSSRGQAMAGPLSTGFVSSPAHEWDAADSAPPPRVSRTGEGPPPAGSAADLPPPREFPPEFSGRTGYPGQAEGAVAPRQVRGTPDPAAAPRSGPARRDRDAARNVLDQVESLLRERDRRKDALREWEETEF
ncbi:MAG TPA: hypothetical protein VMT52_08195 [Planctomycetota bacterium]|nr:hypothetical protein [Planctomycetota bacterium]